MRLIVQGNARSALKLAGISSRAAGGSYGHFNNRLGFNQGRSYASAPLRTESAQKLKSSWRLITGAGIVGIGMVSTIQPRKEREKLGDTGWGEGRSEGQRTSNPEMISNRSEKLWIVSKVLILSFHSSW